MSNAMQSAGGGRMVPQWTIADRLRKTRESIGVNQRTMAEMLGLSMRQIQSAENDEVVAKPLLLMGYAMLTGVDLEWIKTGQEKTPDPEGPGGNPLPDLDSNQEPPGSFASKQTNRPSNVIAFPTVTKTTHRKDKKVA
jgi:transcriptional regulator with XRE-family HTH domain